MQPPLMNPVLAKPALRSPAAAKLSGFFDEKFGAYAYVPICDPPLENLELEVVKNTPGDTWKTIDALWLRIRNAPKTHSFTPWKPSKLWFRIYEDGRFQLPICCNCNTQKLTSWLASTPSKSAENAWQLWNYVGVWKGARLCGTLWNYVKRCETHKPIEISWHRAHCKAQTECHDKTLRFFIASASVGAEATLRSSVARLSSGSGAKRWNIVSLSTEARFKSVAYQRVYEFYIMYLWAKHDWWLRKLCHTGLIA